MTRETSSSEFDRGKSGRSENVQGGDARSRHGRSTNGDGSDLSADELRVARLLSEYLDRCAVGETRDFDELLEQHSDIAPLLRRELETLKAVDDAIDTSEPRRIGDFLLGTKLGEGGMGVVYEARQLSLDRRVAVKVLPRGLLTDARAFARFRLEAKVTGRLQHPNIVSVYATGIDGGTPYYAMEFVEGETLREVQKRLGLSGDKGETLSFSSMSRLLKDLGDGSSSPGLDFVSERPGSGSERDEAATSDAACRSVTRQYCRWVALAFADVAEGVQHANSHGVIHRDIKPANLILDGEGRLRILDFGLARVDGVSGMTGTTVLGTLDYMSPEQARPSPELIGPGTDIYSLGSTLYEMLTGSPPFRSPTPRKVLERIIAQDPVPVRRLNPSVPRDLETIVMKCLRKHPRDRFGTAEALAQELRRFARGDPIETDPPGLYELLARRAWHSRRKLVEVAGTVALAVAVCVLAIVFFVEQRNAASQRYEDRVTELGAKILLRKYLLYIKSNTIPVFFDRPERVELRRELDEGFPLGGSDRLFEYGIGFESGPVFGEVGGDPLIAANKGLDRLIEESRHVPDAYYHLARGLALRGDTASALECLEEARRRLGESLPGLGLRAVILEQAGDVSRMKEAHASFIRMAKEKEASWAEPWLRAQRAELREDWEAVVRAYEELEKLNVAEPYLGYKLEWRLGVGVALLNVGGHTGLTQASNVFSMCKSDWIDRIEPILLLAEAYYLIAGRERASQEFERAEEFERVCAREFERFFARVRGEDMGPSAEEVAAFYRDHGQLEIARKWITRVPSSSNDLMRAEILYHLGDLDDAREAAERAVHHPPKSDAHLILGAIAMAQDALDVAQGHFEAAVDLAALDPDRPERQGWAHYNLGRVLSRLDQLPLAEESYNKAASLFEAVPSRFPRERERIRRGRALVHNNLAVLLDDQEGRAQEAIENYRTALEIAPELCVSHYNLAWRYHRQLDFTRAIHHYEKARDCGFRPSVLYANLAPCLFRFGRWDETIDACKKALGTEQESPRIYHTLGLARLNQGELHEAREALEKRTRIDPEWSDSWKNLAYVYERLGLHDAAIHNYVIATNVDPKSVVAHGDLANLLLRIGAPLPAGRELRDAIRKFEDAGQLVGANAAIAEYTERCREAFQRLASYASVDAEIDGPETLVGTTAQWRYSVGVADPDAALGWTAPDFNPDFDNRSWRSGRAPFGYPAAHGFETELDHLKGAYNALLVRHQFDVRDKEGPGDRDLLLSVRADDGFVAYINGREVARWNAWIDTKEDRILVRPGNWPWKRFPIPDHLRQGENTIAFLVVNCAADDEDFAFSAKLQARSRRPERRLERARSALEQYEGEPEDPEDRLVRLYLQARVLMLEERYPDAQATLEELVQSDDSRPEPYLRLAECLRARGWEEKGTHLLFQALAGGLSEFEELWDAWLRFATVESGQTAADIVGFFDSLATTGVISFEGRPAELRDAFETIAQGGTIRINCGGRRTTSDEGIWGHDRFFVGGSSHYLHDLAREKPDLPDASLYHTSRWFFDLGHTIPAYRIPVPPGKYRVTLHLVEGYYRVPGERIFDIRLEDGKPRSDYDLSKQGFGDVATPLVFEQQVDDGALDLSFDRRKGDPCLAALEVSALQDGQQVDGQ